MMGVLKNDWEGIREEAVVAKFKNCLCLPGGMDCGINGKEDQGRRLSSTDINCILTESRNTEVKWK
jgi:hypothetical protein